MRKADVGTYASRSDAVFATVAYDLIGSRIDNQQTVGTDVVTLIEMNDTSTVVFEREPVTNFLYNTLIERRNGFPRFHGNYIDALSVAKRVLMPGNPSKINSFHVRQRKSTLLHSPSLLIRRKTL
jgi:hypothetical protein